MRSAWWQCFRQFSYVRVNPCFSVKIMIRVLHDTQGRCILTISRSCMSYSCADMLWPEAACKVWCTSPLVSLSIRVWTVCLVHCNNTHTLQGTAKGEGVTLELINTVTTPHASRHSLWMYSTRHRASLGFILFPLNLRIFGHTCSQVKSGQPH